MMTVLMPFTLRRRGPKRQWIRAPTAFFGGTVVLPGSDRVARMHLRLAASVEADFRGVGDAGKFAHENAQLRSKLGELLLERGLEK